jgi:hypothetical protein
MALRALLRLEVFSYKTEISSYEAKKNVLRNVIRNYIANPTNSVSDSRVTLLI